MAKLTKRQKSKKYELAVPEKALPKPVVPITITQKKVFDSFKTKKNLFLSGCPGSGKTFIALYLALDSVLEEKTDQTRVVIVRSAVPVRNQGFLPGTLKEKSKELELPYSQICRELFGRSGIYEEMKIKGYLQFLTTSFIRGTTIDDSIIIVDESSNLTFHELDSIVTRVGKNSKIIFCGDYAQSDLENRDKEGFLKFVKIMEKMNGVDFIEFGIEDIVRSGFVKSYIIEKWKQDIR